MNQSIQKVSLPYVDVTKMNETNLEPQEVTSKNPVATWIYLTNLGLPLDTPANNVVVTANGQVLFERVSRIVPVSFILYNPILPNVNPYNSNIQFFSSVSGQVHSITLATDYYISKVDLFDEIIFKCNALVASTGLNFSYSLFSDGLDLYNLVSAGGTFYILPTCNAVTQGVTLYGFSSSTTLTNTLVVGPIRMTYTNYIDVHSYTLTKYSKLRSISTNNSKSNIFIRADVRLDSQFSEQAVLFYQEIDNNFGFRAGETVNSVDVTLYDMYGNLLYIPPEFQNKFFWGLTISVQF